MPCYRGICVSLATQVDACVVIYCLYIQCRKRYIVRRIIYINYIITKLFSFRRMPHILSLILL